MQFKSLVVLAAITGLVAAQIPACAQPCLNNATVQAGCAVNDYVCACTTANQNTIQTLATTCVVAACGAEEAVTVVLPAAKALCAAALSSSSTSSTPPSTSAGSTSAPSTSAAPTTSASSTSTSTSAAPTTAPPTTSAAPTLSTGVIPSNGTTTSSALAQVTNGAVANSATFGGIVALGMAVLAAF